MSTWHEWRSAPKAQYAVVGDPVEHSLSPAMHNAALQDAGVEAEYVAIRVTLQEFDEALDHLKAEGYLGLNVTVPLKERAYRWAKSMPRSERRMGVVNTLRLEDRAAINTDALGLVDTLRDYGINPRCDALVMGAGGTARAMIVALQDMGCSVRLWNRTRINLDRMINELRLDVPVTELADPSGCHLILNTTSASMQGASLPVDWYAAPKSALAYDVFYTDGPTPFLFEASSNGLQTMDGRALLVAQGARSFEWWTGKKPSKGVMLQAVQ